MGHLPTWGVHLSASYLFAFSYCSWGSQGKNTEVVCHSLLQWTTSCQTSPPWPVCLGWSHNAWLSFIELDKAVVHVIRLACCLWLWFQSICPLTPFLSAYRLIWVSLTLDVRYLFTAAPAKHSRCSLPWTWGSSSQPCSWAVIAAEQCQENALVIANTLFQQHKRRLCTWTSSDCRHWNQIDYILCSQRWRGSIQSAKTRLGADCGSDRELLIAKFRLKLKKVEKTTRQLRYYLNQIPYDYTVEVRNRFKGLDLIDRVPDELWTEVHDTVQETGIKTIPKKKKCKKAK